MTEDVRIGAVITKTAVLESRLDGHEDICAKRYGDIAAAFVELKTQSGRIESRMTGALVSLVMLLATALGVVVWAKMSGG